MGGDEITRKCSIWQMHLPLHHTQVSHPPPLSLPQRALHAGRMIQERIWPVRISENQNGRDEVIKISSANSVHTLRCEREISLLSILWEKRLSGSMSPRFSRINGCPYYQQVGNSSWDNLRSLTLSSSVKSWGRNRFVRQKAHSS